MIPAKIRLENLAEMCEDIARRSQEWEVNEFELIKDLAKAAAELAREIRELVGSTEKMECPMSDSPFDNFDPAKMWGVSRHDTRSMPPGQVAIYGPRNGENLPITIEAEFPASCSRDYVEAMVSQSLSMFFDNRDRLVRRYDLPYEDGTKRSDELRRIVEVYDEGDLYRVVFIDPDQPKRFEIVPKDSVEMRSSGLTITYDVRDSRVHRGVQDC